MAQHLPYSAVADNNRKEFNVMMKWHLDKLPKGDYAQLYHNMVEGSRRDHRRALRHASSTAAAASAGGEGSSTLNSTITTTASKVQLDPLAATTTSSSTGTTAAQVRRAHVRRKHRGNCPKHLMNEIERSGGVVAPLTPTIDSAAAIQDGAPRSDSAPLPKLPVPNMIGRGLGEFLAGVRNPHYDRTNYVHRPTVEHPDFRAKSKAFDATVAKEAPTYEPKKTSQRAPAWLVDDKLLALDIVPDMKHYRKKYEMKTHMEAVRMMGKALLREFSGAAFK
ncbi:Hypothetical protein, putative [Bodo saltans]|uniref:Uncharacterized protein n=1 Tax=Bodo saltans TaxID=75058 RepID=A0A0S4JL36_BODSA|nr:Hypothetical protein, putative [Bodo saltans]|eukprot:CUG90892.1 Hypothetical protein, putative [Bodo saltans]